MITPYQMVREFQAKFHLPLADIPRAVAGEMPDPQLVAVLYYLNVAQGLLRYGRHPEDQLWGRVQMMLEELIEFMDAARATDLPGMADALVDLEYFLLGTAAMMGLPHDEVFSAVHQANMQKVLCASAEESKRLNKLDVKKPAGWAPPDVAGILARAKEVGRARWND